MVGCLAVARSTAVSRAAARERRRHRAAGLPRVPHDNDAVEFLPQRPWRRTRPFHSSGASCRPLPVAAPSFSSTGRIGLQHPFLKSGLFPDGLVCHHTQRAQRLKNIHAWPTAAKNQLTSPGYGLEHWANLHDGQPIVSSLRQQLASQLPFFPHRGLPIDFESTLKLLRLFLGLSPASARRGLRRLLPPGL